MKRIALLLILVPSLIIPLARAGAADGSSPRDETRSDAGSREIVCSQPGLLSMMKMPADTAEVANECRDAGVATVVKATWWGGYIDWEEGDPEVTCFDVRFYDDDLCHPSTLIAAYLSAVPDTTRLGNCTDGFPCFMYELDVEVPVGPGHFWFSIQTACDGGRPYPPRWGRLGDEILSGCGSMWRVEGEEEWIDIPLDPEWDASQEFVVDQPTAVIEETWGSIKGSHR